MAHTSIGVPGGRHGSDAGGAVDREPVDPRGSTGRSDGLAHQH